MLLPRRSSLPSRPLLAARLPGSVDDGPGDRLDPHEVILDGSDLRHIFGGDAQCRAFLLVEDDAVEIDDPILDGDRNAVTRHPRGSRKLGKDAFADLLIAGRRSRS